MIDGPDESWIELGALRKDIRVRLLNGSAQGCLLESDVPLKVGTVGMLRVSLRGETFGDAVEVIRCLAIAGSAGIHHLGMRLLPTTPAYQGSLRHVMSRNRATLGAWLSTKGPQ